MQKIVTINLNGNAYQLEETGYEELRAYLESAATKLRDNPDKAEIIADIEQAIADKCLNVLGPHKTVVSDQEIAQIIKEMGPVEAAENPAGDPGASSGQAKAAGTDGSVRRLYQIREGALLSGICNGLAAYFGLDVLLVRIAFVVLTLLTSGVWALVYFVLMFVIPCAETAEERAAAYGEPFNARELIDQAKQQYEKVSGQQWGHHWWKQGRDSRRQARKARREAYREARRETRRKSRAWMRQMQYKPGYSSKVTAGVMVPIFGILSAAFSLVWVIALISLVTTDEVFGWPLPDDMPLWVGIVILVIVYNVVGWPLRAARRASYHVAGGNSFSWFEVWGRIMSLGFLVLFFWLAYRYVPEVNYLINNLGEIWRNVIL